MCFSESVVVMCIPVVFHGHNSLHEYSTMVTRHFDSTNPRGGGLRIGTGRQFRAEKAVPRAGSSSFKAVNGRGAPEQIRLALPPWRNKRIIIINSDSLEVQVGPVVH